MEYRITQLAKLADVTPRTLRWYDRIGLLCPKRSENGYRSYGSEEVDRLQLILFYREMNLPLADIGRILDTQGFDATEALGVHLLTLQNRRRSLDILITTIERTIAAKTEGVAMSDADKFEAFKRDALNTNEQVYGKEIRTRYGEEEVNESNRRFAGMTEEQYAASEDIRRRLESALREALDAGDPTATGVLAGRACELHRQWLCFFWTDYSAEKHRGVAQLYLDDPHFTEYYERIAPGTAEFLRDAVWSHAERK